MLQIAVIMSNPEQSKHLETARMKVAGLELDLVNLRSEEYAESSRIPTMKFGTPEEDALRCFLPCATPETPQLLICSYVEASCTTFAIVSLRNLL